LSTIDVLDFTEHWLFEDETSCYNLPNLSLVKKHQRKSTKWWFRYTMYNPTH